MRAEANLHVAARHRDIHPLAVTGGILQLLLRGVSRGCSIEENLIINAYYKKPLSRSILFNMAQVGKFA